MRLNPQNSKMRLMLVRNATLVVEIDGRRLLVDPLLSDAEAYPPIENTPNQRRNPLVPLPRPAEELVAGLDGVLVTHLHNDHFDRVAQELLRKDLPLFCQDGDEGKVRDLGFSRVTAVGIELAWYGLVIRRTRGRHGTGELGDALGPVSGFVVRPRSDRSLFIAGDTIWCDEVAEALELNRPDVTVVNAGGAVFNEGDPIVMTVEDVALVCEAAPWTRVVCVHLEALNHCPVTRAELRASGLPVLVPEDGETLDL
jgi:L-ascorbate metabolism protein UlaG (beta-lactamase superfamily)